jgi:hypothetical protein
MELIAEKNGAGPADLFVLIALESLSWEVFWNYLKNVPAITNVCSIGYS